MFALGVKYCVVSVQHSPNRLSAASHHAAEGLRLFPRMFSLPPQLSLILKRCPSLPSLLFIRYAVKMTGDTVELPQNTQRMGVGNRPHKNTREPTIHNGLCRSLRFSKQRACENANRRGAVMHLNQTQQVRSPRRCGRSCAARGRSSCRGKRVIVIQPLQDCHSLKKAGKGSIPTNWLKGTEPSTKVGNTPSTTAVASACVFGKSRISLELTQQCSPIFDLAQPQTGCCHTKGVGSCVRNCGDWDWSSRGSGCVGVIVGSNPSTKARASAWLFAIRFEAGSATHFDPSPPSNTDCRCLLRQDWDESEELWQTWSWVS